jgi:hypothetical protein
MKQHTKNWLSYASVCLMFGVMLWGVLAIQASEIRQFKREGTPANATVISSVKQSSYSSGTGSSETEYVMQVTFMDRSNVVASETSVDILSGKIELPEINIGDFRRAEFTITRDSYEAINEGDTVAILFLPEDPGEAMMAAEVENWQPTLLYILIGITVAGALVCTFIAYFKRPIPAPSEFDNPDFYEQPSI